MSSTQNDRHGPDQPPGLPKLTHYVSGSWTKYEHPGVFERQRTTGPERLYIGPRDRHVDLLADLERCWAGPCVLLYVLVVPRNQHPAGRYQSPCPLDFADAEAFLDRFRSFLEEDARHHLWLASADGANTLVYDHHQVIFAYGDLDAYQAVLTQQGLRAGTISIPNPHAHQYHAEHDDNEGELLSYWNWIHAPLDPADEEGL